jgi:hypothetical protein
MGVEAWMRGKESYQNRRGFGGDFSGARRARPELFERDDKRVPAVSGSREGIG